MDHNEIATLKAELHRMQARLDELEARPDEPVNRRNMLRGIGAAAAGAAVGGLAFARPAAASDGNNLVIGNDSQTAQTPTWLIPSSSWSYDTGRVAGAFTVTNDSSLNNINAGLSCISAYADSTKTGGFNIGLWGASKSGIGAKLDGPVPLKLTDNSGSGAPTQNSGSEGQFKVNSGDLWFCVDGSGSTRWRKITGAGVSGGFHAVTPGRVYDSRPAQGGAGPLSTGFNRTISVANRINPSGGAVVENNFVPANARAVTFNLTVVNTVGSNGYLAVNPGGNSAVNASSINWYGANQIIANGTLSSLNTSRQLTVVAGGTSTSANFIIDITGYYL